MPPTYGVHSEAGQLRRVMVHAPGREMARLTPANREALLFDDVLWVKQARVDHMTFVDALRERGAPVQVDLFDRVSHTTLMGAFAGPLRGLAPVLDRVSGFLNEPPA